MSRVSRQRPQFGWNAFCVSSLTLPYWDMGITDKNMYQNEQIALIYANKFDLQAVSTSSLLLSPKCIALRKWQPNGTNNDFLSA
jgi:hypothetical protein